MAEKKILASTAHCGSFFSGGSPTLDVFHSLLAVYCADRWRIVVARNKAM